MSALDIAYRAAAGPDGRELRELEDELREARRLLHESRNKGHRVARIS